MKWSHAEPSATDEMIAETERRLGIRFPKDFIVVAKEQGGGAPDFTSFPLNDSRLGPTSGTFGQLLSLNPNSKNSIVTAVEDLAIDDQLPKGIIPFGETGGGDYVSFDFRSSPASIVYWYHERDKDESVDPVASSFGTFLSLLRPAS